MRSLIIIFLLGFGFTSVSQPRTDSLLLKLLSGSSYSLVKDVINQKDSFRLQIIYTEINRNRFNEPSFRNYYFNVDTNIYFNPASTVKLPLALLALEKLNELDKKQVNKYSDMLIDSSQSWQSPAYTDYTSEDGKPSIAQYIRKAFLVSDNDAYNRLYQFVGPQTINRKLHDKGFDGTRITRQFLGLTVQQNRYTNAIRFVNKENSLLYLQPAAFNPDSFYFGKTIKLGKGYMNSKDSLINEPIDFTKVNCLPLEDLQQMVKSVMFPESMPKSRRFKLTKNDYSFLYQYLSQFPGETNYPKYDSSEYYDSYVKFFFRNESHKMPADVRVFNKVGWAYGFLIDASYIADFKNDVEYMLSAVIYVNKDGILNDNVYEYDSIGWPFMYQLGQTIYQYELQRPRQFRPDLKKFKVKYEFRKPDDRPTIKNVDN